MTNDFLTDNPELEALYQKYENAPDSHVFAPLADAYRKAGMLEEAAAICDKGVAKHPQYTSGYVVQGKCYYDLDQPDKSERAFRRVLELDQNNLVALKYLGMILLGRGEKDGAMEHFKHVLALDPDNKEIKFKLEDLSVESVRPSTDDEDSRVNRFLSATTTKPRMTWPRRRWPISTRTRDTSTKPKRSTARYSKSSRTTNP